MVMSFADIRYFLDVMSTIINLSQARPLCNNLITAFNYYQLRHVLVLVYVWIAKQ